MTVIKSTNATSSRLVRTLSKSLAEGPSPPPSDPERDALIGQSEALAVALKESEAEIERLELRVSAAYREGETEGRRQGLQDAEQQTAAALHALEAGIARASTLAAAEFDAMQRLAVLLAQEAVGKILGEATDYSELVEHVLRQQLAKLESDAVLQVEVSSEDFPDAAALDQLSESLNRPRLKALAWPDLPAGDCRIRLDLGLLEVGVRQQWERLSGVFDDLAASEPVR